MSIKRSILLRVRVAFIAVCLFAFLVIGRLAQIQFVQKDKWVKASQVERLQYRTIKAVRGNIHSSEGGLLATSLPFYRVAIDPTLVNDEYYKKGIDSLAFLLSSYFQDYSTQEYKRRIHDARITNRKYLVLNRSYINYQEKKKMLRWPIFRLGRLKGGVLFERIERRFLPFKYLASRAIGFINEDKQGAGIEYSFNKELAGQNGIALFQKIAGGAWRPLYGVSEVKAEDGYDVETTIDINLQDVAESALLKALYEHEASYGCLVLMEVKTGKIKAMVNLGRNEEGNYIEDYNYAVGNQGLTDPGSTFKLASMIALFEETSTQLTDTVDTGNGKYSFYGQAITDAKPEGYGVLTVKQVFEKSSNIGTMKLITKTFASQPQKFIDYLHHFGLTQPLGFQLTGESIPYVKTPSDPTWSKLSLPWMSIGYELKISPLQILTFYNAIANKGKMIAPIIATRIKKADQVIKTFEAPTLHSKICSNKVLEKVKVMLEGVVENGTASNVKGTVYRIAGKTGTAQKMKEGRYTSSYYTSFVGYFPADNPTYSCIVVIDEPKGFRQHGSDVSAPVFKEVADKVYATDPDMYRSFQAGNRIIEEKIFPFIKSGYQSDLTALCEELKIPYQPDVIGDWVTTKIVNNKVEWISNAFKQSQMPNVIGMTLKDAIYILENKELDVVFSGRGRVANQSLPEGTKIEEGMSVYLELD